MHIDYGKLYRIEIVGYYCLTEDNDSEVTTKSHGIGVMINRFRIGSEIPWISMNIK